MSVTISCDEEYKGNEYTYDRQNGFWFCSKSSNWRYRYMKAYLLLGCKLTQMAIDEGYSLDLITKYRPATEEKPKKERKERKPKNFISLF